MVDPSCRWSLHGRRVGAGAASLKPLIPGAFLARYEVAVPPSDVARTVLLVDDHPGFRRMARLLVQSGGYDVVGEAATAAEAVASARALEPELVLLDVVLPDGNGADVAEELAGLPHPPGVVLISSHEWVGWAPRLGASRCWVSWPRTSSLPRG